MATRIFALIVGVDAYKSGRIWNLHSCKDDAKNMERWLTNDLGVPREQICLLLDSQATKSRIEDAFMSHLVNNPDIEREDAILFYFAGHGSSIPAPSGWCQGEAGMVSVLCPHDHDTKGGGSRVAGITERSFHALINELAGRGDNITIILDCCFSPPSDPDVRGRGRPYTRWTPTHRAVGEDLQLGLWRGAVGHTTQRSDGFNVVEFASHNMLGACRHGERAKEGLDGGKFTCAFLETVRSLSLHQTSYAQLIEHIEASIDGSQHPICLGANKNRIIFNGVPFVRDPRYVPATLEDSGSFRVETGAIHGVVEGTTFSLHSHNFRKSQNPPISKLSAVEVHSTWSRATCQSKDPCESGWAQITQWNNYTPFRIHMRKTFCSLVRWWRMRMQIPAEPGGKHPKGSLNIVLVKHTTQAHITLDVSRCEAVIERNDNLIISNCHRTIHMKTGRKDIDIVEDAARFHLHLHRRNPINPLGNLISMELYRLDPHSWSKIGGNLLENGSAHIAYDKSAIYTLILRNESDLDLWPYLALMDPLSYGIATIYQPGSSLQTPPLQKHAHLEIGLGKPGSEALSFAIADNDSIDSVFFKLFVSSTFASMRVIEQGSPSTVVDAHDDISSAPSLKPSGRQIEVWDTAFACVTFLRGDQTSCEAKDKLI